MKRIFSPAGGGFIALIAGIIGCALRIWLNFSYSDNKGLLIRYSLPELLTWVLVVLVAVLLIFCVRKAPKKIDYQEAFSRFIPGGLGCIAAALGVVVALLMSPNKVTDFLTYLTTGFGIAAVASLIAMAVCRFKGKRPFFLFPVLVTLYYMLYLITQYRYWSAQPQLQVYLFTLLALLLLMLTSYYRAALSVDHGNYRAYLFFNRLSVFFCCLALLSAGWEVYLFYLTTAMWLLADCGSVPEAD